MPQQVNEYWMPTKEDIILLEKLLPEYIKKNSSTLCTDLDKDLSKYKRQYGGLIINGRKIIYVSAVQAYDESPEDASLASHHSAGYEPLKTIQISWESMSICDGGCSSWGIEFDVKSNQFLHLEINYGGVSNNMDWNSF